MHLSCVASCLACKGLDMPWQSCQILCRYDQSWRDRHLWSFSSFLSFGAYGLAWVTLVFSLQDMRNSGVWRKQI